MKKIELSGLMAMGANDKQLNTYSNSDPFDIFENEDGTYAVDGIVVGDGYSVQNVLDLLDELGEEE